jgi:hypothetical protein
VFNLEKVTDRQLLEALHSEMLETRKEMNEKFQKVDKRLMAIDQRFVAIDQRFEAVDKRFVAIDQRFESLEKQFGKFQLQLNAQNEILQSFKFDVDLMAEKQLKQERTINRLDKQVQFLYEK